MKIISLILILLPLVACAPTENPSNNQFIKISTGPDNFAFSSDLTNAENGLAISVNGDNVTTWNNECTSETKKLSEVDESLRKLIESNKNGLMDKKRSSFMSSTMINGLSITTIAHLHRSYGNFESGTYPCGSVELRPMKCLNDSDRELVETSKEDFQTRFMEDMKRNMERLQWNIQNMERNINQQFMSNFPMNFANPHGNNFPFGNNNSPFGNNFPFGNNNNPFGPGFPFAGRDHLDQ